MSQLFSHAEKNKWMRKKPDFKLGYQEENGTIFLARRKLEG